MPQKRMDCFRLLLERLAWIEHQFLRSIRDSRKAGGLWGNMRSVRGVRKSVDHSWLAKGLCLGIGLLCWGFKGVQERLRRKRPILFKSGPVIFPPGQCTSPQLHPCHRLFDQDGHQNSSSPTPIVETLLPVTYDYSLTSETVFMRQLRRWKRLWIRSLTRSHKRTSIGLSEVVRTVQQVIASRRRLFRRGL